MSTYHIICASEKRGRELAPSNNNNNNNHNNNNNNNRKLTGHHPTKLSRLERPFSHCRKKRRTIQNGYRKYETHTRVFSQTLEHENSKNEIR